MDAIKASMGYPLSFCTNSPGSLTLPQDPEMSGACVDGGGGGGAQRRPVRRVWPRRRPLPRGGLASRKQAG